MQEEPNWLSFSIEDNDSLGWNLGKSAKWTMCDNAHLYTCVDGLTVKVLEKSHCIGPNWTELSVPSNCIYYNPYESPNKLQFRCIVSAA